MTRASLVQCTAASMTAFTLFENRMNGRASHLHVHAPSGGDGGLRSDGCNEMGGCHQKRDGGRKPTRSTSKPAATPNSPGRRQGCAPCRTVASHSMLGAARPLCRRRCETARDTADQQQRRQCSCCNEGTSTCTAANPPPAWDITIAIAPPVQYGKRTAALHMTDERRCGRYGSAQQAAGNPARRPPRMSSTRQGNKARPRRAAMHAATPHTNQDECAARPRCWHQPPLTRLLYNPRTPINTPAHKHLGTTAPTLTTEG